MEFDTYYRPVQLWSGVTASTAHSYEKKLISLKSFFSLQSPLPPPQKKKKRWFTEFFFTFAPKCTISKQKFHKHFPHLRSLFVHLLMLNLPQWNSALRSMQLPKLPEPTFGRRRSQIVAELAISRQISRRG